MDKEVAVSEESLQTNVAKQVLNIASKLSEAENTGLNLVKRYLEMKQDEKKRFVLFTHGTKENVDTETGEVSYSDTVDIMDAEKQLFFTQSHVIVQALANAKEGTAFEVTYLGEKKLTGKKTLKNYSIELLNL